MKFLHRLYLAENSAVHQEIAAEALFELQAVVLNWDRLLTANFEASLPQLMSEAYFIDAF